MENMKDIEMVTMFSMGKSQIKNEEDKLEGALRRAKGFF